MPQYLTETGSVGYALHLTGSCEEGNETGTSKERKKKRIFFKRHAVINV
jgi:hypothetical protein